jgi:hypothetical protein
MTTFSPITGTPAFTTSNLQPCPVTINGTHYQNCSTVLIFVTGDDINGNSTPFEIGTMTIANDGSGPGDLTLWTGDYIDANLNNPIARNATSPQVLAVAAPEPGTLLLLGVGVGGLVAVRARRPHTVACRPPAADDSLAKLNHCLARLRLDLDDLNATLIARAEKEIEGRHNQWLMLEQMERDIGYPKRAEKR